MSRGCSRSPRFSGPPGGLAHHKSAAELGPRAIATNRLVAAGTVCVHACVYVCVCVCVFERNSSRIGCRHGCFEKTDPGSKETRRTLAVSTKKIGRHLRNQRDGM